MGVPVQSIPAKSLIGVRKIAAGPKSIQPLLSILVHVITLKARNVLIMQVLVVLVVFLLSLDCLGFSWPRQTKETMDDDSETSIPEGLSSLGGLDRSSLCVTLIHVKTVCSIAENSVLCVSVLVRLMSFLTVLISATPYYIIRSVGVIFA